MSHSVERGERVRARVGDNAVPVESNETVRGTRLAEFRHVPECGIGKITLGNHSENLFRCLNKCLSLPVCPIVNEQCVPCENGNRRFRTPPADWNRSNVVCCFFNPDGLIRFNHGAPFEALGEQICPRLARPSPDNVAIEDGVCIPRAEKCRTHKTALACLKPQCDVRQSQVGDQLPLANEIPKPFDIIRGEVGFLRSNRRQCWHVSRVPKRQPRSFSAPTTRVQMCLLVRERLQSRGGHLASHWHSPSDS